MVKSIKKWGISLKRNGQINSLDGEVNGGTLFNLSSNATEPKIRDAIEKNIKKLGGDAAIDVKIKYGSNPGQWILTWITLGIWMPGTVTVTGTVVKAVD